MKRILPDFKHENPIWDKNLSVLGVDEAGRGAFAGPLAVAGVLIDKSLSAGFQNLEINDSKLLSPKKREELYEKIKNKADFSHVELIDLKTINNLGIAKATILGMEKIYNKAYEIRKDIHALIDAFKIPEIKNQTSLVHGDRISKSIAAASIMAKVERDKYMEKLANDYAHYGWEKNKGYGTLIHRQAIKEFGPCEHHRTQFIAAYI